MGMGAPLEQYIRDGIGLKIELYLIVSKKSNPRTVVELLKVRSTTLRYTSKLVLIVSKYYIGSTMW